MLVPQSSPEKMRRSDLFMTLLLCCFCGEESQALKRPSLRSVKRLARKNTSCLLVVVM
jgi:hypothetical protein